VFIQERALGNGHVKLWSIPFHAQVQDPKTTSAEIGLVTVSDPSKWTTSDELPFSELAELLSTSDGHMLAGRLLGAATDIAYTLDSGQTARADFSLFYAYAQDACNVAEWTARDGGTFTSLRPIPAAPYDRRIHGTYGIAARPLRDSFGHVFAETDVLPGSYPWFDREGNNLIFSTINPEPLSRDATMARYPIARENGALQFVGSSPRGFAVVGAWTQGKTIMLDGMINNEDLGFTPADTHRLGLYRASSGPMMLRVNGGSKFDTGMLDLPFAHANNHHIESLENRNAVHLNSLAVTPRDVVWNVTRGLASDEIAFDDYIDPNVILLAEMNGAWSNDSNPRNGSYLDGFGRDAVGGAFTFDPTRIRVQNAAASQIYPIAEPGYVDGDARVEPVALGGIRGRGLWLDGAARLRFPLPEPLGAATAGLAFYTGLFVDARDDLSGTRHLLSFVDAASAARATVSLEDGSQLAVTSGGQTVRIDLSCAVTTWDHAWHHLGFLFDPGGAVTVFVDGNALATEQLTTPVTLAGGALIVGAGPSQEAGVRGWYDEVRLVVDGAGQLTHGASVELACNYARGTSAAVAPTSPFRDAAVAVPYARTRAAALGVAMPAAPKLLACATNYHRERGVGRGVLPDQTVAWRDQVLLEGAPPLAYDRPRPDSRGRSFCGSCHPAVASDPGRPEALTRSALTPGTMTLENDPRMQPLQPPARLAAPTSHGWVPAGWLLGNDGQRYPANGTSDPTPLVRWMFR
jgi:hypothetical protein